MAEPFTIPYRSFVDGDPPRPYLVATMTGVNGASGTVAGIVDSGADTTSLPFDYAALLGYTGDTLSEETFLQAGGTGTAYLATVACSSYVPEIPEVVIETYPQFIKGSQMVLWGRRDFMMSFDVTISESSQCFTIRHVGTPTPEFAPATPPSEIAPT